MGKLLLICAASCPFFMIVGGLLLLDNELHVASPSVHLAGIMFCLAGVVDLLGYSVALFGESKRGKQTQTIARPLVEPSTRD